MRAPRRPVSTRFLDALPAASTVLTDVVVGPNYMAGVVSTSGTTGCNLQITASTFIDNLIGVWAVGCGLAFPGPVEPATRIGDGTPAGRVTFQGHTGTGFSKNSAAVQIWDCAGPLVVDTNTFIGNDSGISLGFHDGADLAHVAIVDNDFTDHALQGIHVDGATHIDVLEGNSFSANRSGNATLAAALRLTVRDTQLFPQVILARGNSFLDNDVGVYVAPSGVAMMGNRASDFGVALSAGNNVFSCNDSPSGTSGHDVLIDTDNVVGVTMSFNGNQWDHVGPTTGDPGVAADGTDLVVKAGFPAPDVGDAGIASNSCP